MKTYPALAHEDSQTSIASSLATAKKMVEMIKVAATTIPLPVEEQAAESLDKPKGGRKDAEDPGKNMLAIEDLDHVDQASRSTNRDETVG